MSDRKVFHDSVTPLPARPGLTPHGLMVQEAKAQNNNEVMPLLFSLSIPADLQQELESRVENGEVIPVDEIKRKYVPNVADLTALESWLKTQGYLDIQVAGDGTGIYAKCDVAKIQQSLQVTMVRVTKDGLTYTAAQNAPSLPADVANGVQAIIGLQPFRKAHKHSRTRSPKSRNRSSLTAERRTSASLSPNVDNAPPYLVHEILRAYNADDLPVTGTGQSIAILIDTFPADADLTAFWKVNNVPCTLDQIEKINVNEAALPAPEGEETLDVEWASGIAPGAKIRIYASGSLEFVDLDKALDRIFADVPTQGGMKQLSISLGLGEQFLGGPQGEVATQHHKFVRLAAAGVNVFVSSGDAGSNPDDTGHSSSGPTQAEYEASDPFVIGVGGTTLNLGPSGQVHEETGWADSGGGKSIFFKRPKWQKGNGVPIGHERLVPDVSLTANPDEGAFLLLNGKPVQIGGTSWSAPVWAGFCARINEARTNAGKPTLPFLNPLIYPLMESSSFRDIIVGTNGAFEANKGYDLVTGIGVPNMKELIDALTK